MLAACLCVSRCLSSLHFSPAKGHFPSLSTVEWMLSICMDYHCRCCCAALLLLLPSSSAVWPSTWHPHATDYSSFLLSYTSTASQPVRVPSPWPMIISPSGSFSTPPPLYTALNGIITQHNRPPLVLLQPQVKHQLRYTVDLFHPVSLLLTRCCRLYCCGPWTWDWSF